MAKSGKDDDDNYYISLSDMMSGVLMIFIILFAGFLYYMSPKLPKPSRNQHNLLNLLDIPPCFWDEPASLRKVEIPVKIPGDISIEEPIEFRVAAKNGTATEEDDFILGTSLIALDPESQGCSIALYLLHDDLAEESENFHVVLYDHRFSPPLVREIPITLHDRESEKPLPVLSINQESFAEPSTGTSTHGVMMNLDRPCDAPVRFLVQSMNGSATAGADYEPVASILLMKPGASQISIPVTLMSDDDSSEGTEYFEIITTIIEGASAGNLSSKVEIQDYIPKNPEKTGKPEDELARVFADIEEVKGNILTDVKKSLNKRLPDVNVELDVSNGIIRLPSSLLFDSGRDELQSSGVDVLEVLGEILAHVIPSYSNEKFRLESVFIEGHTDNKPINRGRFRDNWDLSTSRAASSYRAMLKNAPVLSSLRNGSGKVLFSVSGYGEERPIDDNDTEFGRQRNRRIDLRFVMSPPGEDVYRSIIRRD